LTAPFTTHHINGARRHDHEYGAAREFRAACSRQPLCISIQRGGAERLLYTEAGRARVKATGSFRGAYSVETGRCILAEQIVGYVVLPWVSESTLLNNVLSVQLPPIRGTADIGKVIQGAFPG
jgi:hypothetical protein